MDDASVKSRLAKKREKSRRDHGNSDQKVAELVFGGTIIPAHHDNFGMKLTENIHQFGLRSHHGMYVLVRTRYFVDPPGQ